MGKSTEIITLAKLRTGSEQSFKKVYNENRSKFINYARRYELSEDDLIDVYQDAYIVFYNNVVSGKLKTLTSSLSTYLISIGKYKVMERLRENKKQIPFSYDFTRVGEKDHVLEELDLHDEELSLEQQLLQKHFSSLGKKCQHLLKLFYYKGLTISEITATEGYNNENVVKSQKSRCLRSLKELVKE